MCAAFCNYSQILQFHILTTNKSANLSWYLRGLPFLNNIQIDRSEAFESDTQEACI